MFALAPVDTRDQIANYSIVLRKETVTEMELAQVNKYILLEIHLKVNF